MFCALSFWLWRIIVHYRGGFGGLPWAPTSPKNGPLLAQVPSRRGLWPPSPNDFAGAQSHPAGNPGSWHLDLENQEWVIGYHNWRPTGRQIFAHVSYWHPTAHFFLTHDRSEFGFSVVPSMCVCVFLDGGICQTAWTSLANCKVMCGSTDQSQWISRNPRSGSCFGCR